MKRAPLWADISLMASNFWVILRSIQLVSTNNTDDILPIYVPHWQGERGEFAFTVDFVLTEPGAEATRLKFGINNLII